MLKALKLDTPRKAHFLKSVEAVVDLLSLPPGWNSYSAKPIAPRNAAQAIWLLAEFLEPRTPPPAVVPTSQGGIQLEWHTKEIDIEVCVDSPEAVSFFAWHVESGETFEGALAGREQLLKAWVRRISAHRTAETKKKED